MHDLALEKFFGKHSWTQAWAGCWCSLEILKRTSERCQDPVLWTCSIRKQLIILLSYFPRMNTLKDNTKVPSVDHLKLNILRATKTTLSIPKRCKHHHPFYMGVPQYKLPPCLPPPKKYTISSAPTKWSLHFKAMYHNIVGHSMLHLFGNPVTTCYRRVPKCIATCSMLLSKNVTICCTDIFVVCLGL